MKIIINRKDHITKSFIKKMINLETRNSKGLKLEPKTHLQEKKNEILNFCG